MRHTGALGKLLPQAKATIMLIALMPGGTSVMVVSHECCVCVWLCSLTLNLT